MQSLSPRRSKNRFRRLLAERLERRHLLAAVTAVSPLANTFNAATTTDVSITVDSNVNGSTADLATISIHGSQRGRLTDGDASLTVTDATVVIDPASEFLAGEKVQATVTAGLQNAAAEPVGPFVWQFRAAVTSGGADFSDSGLVLSNRSSTDAALGDLDGDGDLDAFVSNRNGPNAIWFNNGTQFSDSGQRLGDHDSFGVELGDVDGDGDLDAFVVNLSQGNRVWINEGGAFVDSGQQLGTLSSLDVSLGDLDGDGDLDAVVANSLQGNRVWLNQAGVFTGGQLLGGSSSNGIELGDVDADGDLDLFVANSYQPNRVWINDGGLFSDSGQSLGSQASRDVSLGDVDADGDLDALVANSGQPNRLWLNAGGVFSDSGQELGAGRAYGVTLDDLDADGDLDAWVARVEGGNQVWLNANGVFSDSGQRLGGDATSGLATGDLDRDGDVDVFVANSGPNRIWLNQNPSFSISPSTVAAAEGNSGSTTFRFNVTRAVDTRGAASVDFAVAPSGDNPAEAADFEGGVLLSGTLNFADGVASQTIDVQVVGDVLSENDETFQVTLSNPVGPNTVIVSGSSTGVIRNDDNIDLGDLPAPFFTRLADNGAAHNAVGPTLGFVRDSEPDGQPTATADGDDSNGDDEDGVTFGASIVAGQIDAEVTVVASAPALLDAWVDFNRDGTFGGVHERIFVSQAVNAGDNVLTFAVPADAIPGATFARFRLSTAGGLAPTGGAADGEVEDYVLTIANPTGTAIFGDSLQELGFHSSLAVALGDLDSDGDLDAFVANGNREGNRVWLNSDGTFSDSGQQLGDAHTNDVALGDLDADGDLDAVVSNDSGNRVWINAGGVFTDSGQSLGVKQSTAVALGDFDGDGDLDALFANDGQDNRIWLNDGGILTDSGQSLGNAASRGVAVGDLDNDGDLDAITANYGQPNRVWLNQGGVFQDSGQTLGDHFSQDVQIGDLDGDGDLDAFIANTDQGDRVWFNEGGTFTDSGQTLGDHFSFAAALGDLDGDGDLDVMIASGLSSNPLEPSSGNRVLRNDGGVLSDFGQPLGEHSSFGIDLGDVDGDGDLDAFSANYYQPQLGTPRVPQANRVWLNLQGTSLVSILAGDVSRAEGDSDVTPYEFQVHRSGDLSTTASVNFEVVGGGLTPADPADFGGVFPSGVITFAVSESTQTLTVNVTGDTEVETTEQFTVVLSEPSPATVELLHTTANGIVENDDLTPITVFLTADSAEIIERQGVANVAAVLSTPATIDVTVDLGISGSATVGDDFTASATQIVIPAGETLGEVTIVAVDDVLEEDDETIAVEITGATNAAIGLAQQTITIVDDDAPRPLQLTLLTPTPAGFRARFSTRLDTSVLNLFDTQTGGLGAADLVVEGASTGPVAGTMLVSPGGTELTFVRSGAPLAPDLYTVTLRSAADGFRSDAGGLLDGNADGTAGDDFVGTFQIVPLPTGSVTIDLPDFVRGPGQPVNVPADTGAGLPLSISNGAGVTRIEVRLAFDPARLEPAGIQVGAEMPPGSAAELNVINNTGTQGIAEIVFVSPVALAPGLAEFVRVEASVPTASASDIYASHQIVEVQTASVTDADENSIAAIGDSAIHLVSFFGEVSGNGRLNAGDASRVARVAAQLDTGFLATPLVDPLVVADISGNGRLNSGDASLIAQAAARFPVPEIPPLPDGLVINLAGGIPRPTEPPEAVFDELGAGSFDTGADHAASWSASLTDDYQRSAPHEDEFFRDIEWARPNTLEDLFALLDSLASRES